MNERTIARILLGIVLAIAAVAFFTLIFSAIDGMLSRVNLEFQKVLDRPGIQVHK